MIDHDGKLATSDAKISRNRTISMDVSHESGIGSDSDSANGVDPTLTPSTPSPRWLNDDQPTLTSGHMTSAELVHDLAERYAGDVPHDVMNVRLEDEFLQYVTPPPPRAEVILTPEVDSKNSRPPAEKRAARRLPAVPSSETTSDEVPVQSRKLTEPLATKKSKDERQDDSAQLWKKAASVGSKERATIIINTPGHSAKAVHHSPQTAANVDQTGSGKDRPHARSTNVVTTSGFQDVQEQTQRDQTSAAANDVVTVSTLPRSRDRHQPISDDAPAISDQQRVEVVKAPHSGAYLNGEERTEWTLADDNRATVDQRPDVTSLETFRPVQQSANLPPELRHHHRHHHHHHHQQQQTASRVDMTENDLTHILQPLQQIVDIQDSRHHVLQKLDRNWVENGTNNGKWRSHADDMNCYLYGKSGQSDDVIKPEVTSDRRHHMHVTSPDRDRQQHVISARPEVGVANPPLRLIIPNNQQQERQGRRSSEGKLLDRRLAAGRGGMTKEQMRVSVDRFTAQQRQLREVGFHRNNNSNSNNLSAPVYRHGELTATSSESNSPQTPSEPADTLRKTAFPVDTAVYARVYRGSSADSCSSPSITSQPSSPSVLDYDVSSHPAHQAHMRIQPVPHTRTPARHHTVSPGGPLTQQSCPRPGPDNTRLDEATRRQMKYEEGLRRYGPNHQPQHSWSDDDEDHSRQQAPVNGNFLLVV